MDQSTLNRDMVEQGVARYRRRVQSARERGSESEAPYSIRIMRNYLPQITEDVAKRFEFHRKYRHAIPAFMPLIWNMDVNALCLLAFKSVLDGICERRPLTSAAIRLSSYIEDELRYCRMKEEYPDVWKYAERDRLKHKGKRRSRDAWLRHDKGETRKGNMEQWRTWTRKEKLTMGTWFLEIIRTNTHVIMFQTISDAPNKTVLYVTATEELFDWIQDYNKHSEVLKPLWLPTVEPPQDWKSILVGGYDKNAGVPPLCFIKSFDHDYLDSLDKSELKHVFDAVNHLQKTQWRVNNAVLDVVRWAWENNKEIGDMTRRSDYETPPWNPAYETDDDARKEFSRKCGAIHRLNISLKSQRLHTIKLLYMADKFENEVFYYPYHIDFRGRMYPIPYFLQPQGNDLSKSLLRFAISKEIKTDEDAKWLAIHGANCFGNDKLSFDERVKWVKSKRREIEEVYEDPKTNDWWASADSPWQFLAFCLEWGEYLKVGKGFLTTLPCAMDASNNGIQILSLLGRDEEGGRSTNVTHNDTPADLYGEISDKVNEELMKRAKDGDHISSAWLKFGVDRKTTKLPVMVKPYGGTRYSCRDLVQQWYNDKCKKLELDPFGYEATVAIGELSQIIWNTMNASLRKPNKVMAWLQQAIRVVNKDDKYVEWTTPLGFRVRQRYFATKMQRIQTLLGDKISWINYHLPLEGVDKQRQANAISPNFVHSLDASVAQKTALMAKVQGIDSLAMVHDSIATHCTECCTLGKIIRQSTADIFLTDQLAKFRDEITQQTERELPELPKYGSLDPKAVLDSEYFFA